MRSTRKQIYLSVAMGLGMASVSSASMAAILMEGTAADFATGLASAVTATSAPKYAQEISLETTTTLGALSTGVLSAAVKSGYGVSQASNAIFYRFDLTNATYATPANLKLTVGVNTAGSLGAASTTISTTSSANDFVIFNATANASAAGGGAGGISQDTPLLLEVACVGSTATAAATCTANGGTAGALLKPKTKGPIKLKYRVFGTSTDAFNGTNAYKTAEVTIADFASAVDFGVIGGGTTPLASKISATNNFGQFIFGSAGDVPFDGQKTTIGKFWLAPVTGTLLTDGTAVTGLGQILDLANTKFSIGGNFSTSESTTGTATTASGVFFSSSACSGATLVAPSGFATVTTTGSTTTSIVLSGSGLATAGLGSSGSPTWVCYNDKAGTAESINAGDFTIKPVLAASGTGFSVTQPSELTMGRFSRDGTELQATFVAGLSVAGPTGVGGVNRFVFSNTGTSNASVLGVRLLNATATATATPITIPTTLNTVIPAGGVLKIDAADLLPAGTGRTSVVFTIGADSSAIKGSYQLLMPNSATQSVVQMVPASQSK